MTGSDSAAVAGGPARHLPVLAGPAVKWLGVRAGGVYVDATFGAGGYARAILATPGTRVIGIDRDPDAIAEGAAFAAEAGDRLLLFEERFSNLEAVLHRANISAVDGVVFDLGVSSMQLDAPRRGFSFRLEGPLDMRMGREGPSAADVVARASERDLAAIIATLGEERHARSVARAIVETRQEQTIATTRALADVVAGVVRAREGAIHPATRTFQALRIFVNEELMELTRGLTVAERVLRPGGRLVVVAFHSLEDRIVKNFFAAHSRPPAGSRHRPENAPAPPTLHVLTRRPETPDESETAANPRARSAKLRASERTDEAPRGAPVSALPPPLPLLADIVRGRR